MDGGTAGGGLWADVFVPTPLLQGALVLAPGQPHCRRARSRAFWVERGVPQHHRTRLAIWGGRLRANYTIKLEERLSLLGVFFNLFSSLKNLLSLPRGQFLFFFLTKVFFNISFEKYFTTWEICERQYDISSYNKKYFFFIQNFIWQLKYKSIYN